MKTHFDCFSCFLNQTKRVGLLLGLTESQIWQLLRGSAKILIEMDVKSPPPKNAVAIYEMISNAVASSDPFKSIKRESIEHALDLYPILEKRVRESNDPLETAIRYCVAGNVIDYGISSDFDLLKEIETVVHEQFFRWDYGVFKELLEKSEWVLIIGDNCGESVFDKLLIRELNKPVYYAVRGGPIINDVTEEEARLSGLKEVSSVISTGCKAPGIIFDWCSKEFLDLFKSAPLIISKGQGNFETLSDVFLPKIFYLFKIKCQVVSSFLSCPLNSLYFGRYLA